jgi:eukaryotic-like serine/threonine-protein kinase
MTSRVQSLFHEVADLTGEQRHEYYTLHEVSDADRSELERLIYFDREGSDPLGQVISDAASRVIKETAVSPGTRCGPYRLLELLGQGGMGAVYRAERVDGEITHQVAIKTCTRPWVIRFYGIGSCGSGNCWHV